MADFSGQQVDLITLNVGSSAAQLIAAGGIASDSTIGLVGVAQYSMNSVDVGFDRLPLFFDPFALNDAANRGLFSLSSPDGAPLVQHVELVGPGVVRVFADAAFVAGREYLLEVSPALISEDAEAFDGDVSASFVSFARGSSPAESSTTDGRTDILNQPLTDSLGGSFEYDATGDLANETGVSYLRKRVIRRLVTVAGGFFHLPGYGVAQKLKGRITPIRIRELEKRASSQVLREPDVRRAKVSADVNGSIMTITASITTVDGTVVPVTATIDLEK